MLLNLRVEVKHKILRIIRISDTQFIENILWQVEQPGVGTDCKFNRHRHHHGDPPIPGGHIHLRLFFRFVAFDNSGWDVWQLHGIFSGWDERLKNSDALVVHHFPLRESIEAVHLG